MSTRAYGEEFDFRRLHQLNKGLLERPFLFATNCLTNDVAATRAATISTTPYRKRRVYEAVRNCIGVARFTHAESAAPPPRHCLTALTRVLLKSLGGSTARILRYSCLLGTEHRRFASPVSQDWTISSVVGFRAIACIWCKASRVPARPRSHFNSCSPASRAVKAACTSRYPRPRTNSTRWRIHTVGISTASRYSILQRSRTSCNPKHRTRCTTRPKSR